MAAPQYRLTVEFLDQGPATEPRIGEAEALLREELWTGLVTGHVAGGGCFRILVVTSAPQPCLVDIERRLRWLHLAPSGACYQELIGKHFDCLEPIGMEESLPVHSMG